MSNIGDFDHEPTGRDAIKEVRELLFRANDTGYYQLSDRHIVADLFEQEGNILFICKALEERYDND